MEQKLLELVKSQYNVTEIPMGEYEKIDKKGMHFITHAYHIEGVGHLSIMTMKGMLGLMKMKTAILTPYEKDMPLMSYDFIQVMKNNILLCELYDTTVDKNDYSSMVEVKEKYFSIPNGESEPCWYDSIKLAPTLKKKTKKKEDLDKLSLEWMEAFLKLLATARSCNPEEKNEKNKYYVDGLLNNGGPSTEQFIKMIGKEKTKEFYYSYMFGIRK